MPYLIILLRVFGHPAHTHDLLFIRPTASMILLYPPKLALVCLSSWGFVVALHCVAFGAVLALQLG